MVFSLKFTQEAAQALNKLKHDPSLVKRYRAVCKALAYLENNPKHPGLNTHKYESLSREYAVDIFEAYAENKTPQAYRIFWHYGPDKRTITVIAITPHP